MSASLRYIHPTALAALERAFQKANLRPVIVQTEGTAPESAGTHGVAGYYKDPKTGAQVSYSACIDLSVNQKALRLSDNKPVVMDSERIKWLLYCLSKEGFCAWYRTKKQGFSAFHIHIVCSMVPVAGLPESQVIDFLNDRNGLKGHADETFWTADADVDHIIADLFIKANPESKARVPAKYR